MKFPTEIPMLCPACNQIIPIPTSLGKRLYYKRKALGLTRLDVCNELDTKNIPLSQATLRNFELETTDIRLKLLKELAIIYNTNLFICYLHRLLINSK